MKNAAELKSLKKENQIDRMTADEVLNELKQKRLPTYGTAQERRDRLKKQFGIQPKAKSAISQSAVAGAYSNMSSSAALMAANGGQAPQRKVTITDKIDQIKINRDARRMKMEQIRKLKSERETNNQL